MRYSTNGSAIGIMEESQRRAQREKSSTAIEIIMSVFSLVSLRSITSGMGSNVIMASVRVCFVEKSSIWFWSRCMFYNVQQCFCKIVFHSALTPHQHHWHWCCGNKSVKNVETMLCHRVLIRSLCTLLAKKDANQKLS